MSDRESSYKRKNTRGKKLILNAFSELGYGTTGKGS